MKIVYCNYITILNKVYFSKPIIHSLSFILTPSYYIFFSIGDANTSIDPTTTIILSFGHVMMLGDIDHIIKVF